MVCWNRDRQRRAAEGDKEEDRRYERKERFSKHERPSDRQKVRDHRHDMENRYASRMERKDYAEKGYPEEEAPVRRGRGTFRGGPDQEIRRNKPGEAKFREGDRDEKTDQARTGAPAERVGPSLEDIPAASTGVLVVHPAISGSWECGVFVHFKMINCTDSMDASSELVQLCILSTAILQSKRPTKSLIFC